MIPSTPLGPIISIKEGFVIQPLDSGVGIYKWLSWLKVLMDEFTPVCRDQRSQIDRKRQSYGRAHGPVSDGVQAKLLASWLQ